MKLWVIAFIASLILTACARHVVLHPQESYLYNDSDWNVISKPGEAKKTEDKK